MTARLDAIEVSDLTRTTYLRYLRTLLPVSDPSLQDAIHSALSHGDELVRGPLLESTPPYEPGASLRQLIDQGVLSDWFQKLDHPGGIPLDRPLHLHQEQAVRRAGAGRNVVVATGTGSGKTESFMLPILQQLADEAESGTLEQPGVRALLLYPMNALANDQLKRLRGLLANTPEITFGRYTGETRHDPDSARAQFAQRHPGTTPLANELLSREEMQAQPPHLLLTNYAMLEYLLLRPRDTTLFDGDTGRHWTWVVLDEAHVYDGAQGIEVAMLLRRLADRVSPDRSLRAIATSATVGGADAGPQVAEFAQTLLGGPFEYEADDEARQDVVWAVRVQRQAADPWGPLPPEAYAQLATADDLATALADHVPVAGDPAAILAAEARMQRAERLLSDRPWSVREVAVELFGDDPNAVRWTGDLVALGAATRLADGAPLIPARYHLWARATEGAFACLGPDGPHVHLTRHEVCATCGQACFEIGSCKRCSTAHLVGAMRTVAGGRRFGPTAQREPLRWLVLLDEDADASITPLHVDEDEAILEQLDLDPEKYRPCGLCVACGMIVDSTEDCACGGTVRRVLEVEASGNLTSCGLCGGRSQAGQIRRLTSGTDASVSVLSTALYQALPPDSDPDLAEKPGAGRKLLFFADSRQDAAYFAPYLEDTYADIVRRRILYRAIEDVSKLDDEPLLGDVAHRAAKVAAEYGVFDWKASAAEKTRATQTWVHGELVSVSGAVSLEGLGLVTFGLRRPPGVAMPAPLLGLGLDDGQAWKLVCQLIRTLRGQGAVTVPDNVAPDDEIFQPRTGPIYVRESGPEAKRKILSWLPGRGVNGRIDYLRRLLLALGADVPPDQVADGIWRWLTEALPVDRQILWQGNHPAAGIVHAVDHTLITASLVTSDRPVHRCSTCLRLTPYALLGVCPTIGCTGSLEAWWPVEPADDDHHYRALARTLNAVPMRISEHTAQLTNAEAAETQERFLTGELNALSCSTTFELGVDVGELQSVVLRNVPPRVANYVQRAGRAGRRTDSAALVLTYAQQRSHDLTYFRDPARMISGSVSPPRVSVRNHRIAARHAQAIAIAAYLRDAFDVRGVDYRRAEDLFGDSGEDQQLVRWLESIPAAVTEAARRVVPDELHRAVGLDDGAWAERLIALVQEIGLRHREDVGTYRELAKSAADDEQYGRAGMYKAVAATFERRAVLSELARHNVLPKYGFPIDTVDLMAQHVGTPESTKVELSRDLRLAISDYAPGSQIVAAGHVWESGGVRRMPNREFPLRHYATCRCGWYRQSLTPFTVETCPVCQAGGKDAPRTRTYIEPEFGFVTVKAPPKRPKRRPDRVYSNTVHLVADEDESATEAHVLPLEGGIALEHRYVERGELVVINSGEFNLGYRICRWCGAGSRARPGQRQQAGHTHPVTGKDCGGTYDWRSLGHTFETDVLQLRFHGLHAPTGADVWWGLMYALVEAASDVLHISRDDLDGTLHFAKSGVPTIVLFDDVPAGAGHMEQVRRSLDRVVRAAHRRVAECECGSETSCYRCLRGFRNQRLHDSLRRGAVAELLGRAVGAVAQTADGGSGWQPVDVQDLRLLDGREVRVDAEGAPREGTLWVEHDDDGEIVACMLQMPDGQTVDLDPSDRLVVNAVREIR